MRLITLCIVLAGCTAPQLSSRLVDYNARPLEVHQQAQVTDSAYNGLLNEFPDYATFGYAIVSSTSTGSGVEHAIMDVSIKTCVFSYTDRTTDARTNTLAAGYPDDRMDWATRGSNRGMMPEQISLPAMSFYRFSIPLTAIDPKSYRVRGEKPRGDYHFDAPPWMLHFTLQRHATSPMTLMSMTTKYVASLSQLEIEFPTQEAAIMAEKWFKGAAKQCHAWPATVIRIGQS